MSLADFVVAAVGIAIGFALGFFAVRSTVIRWLSTAGDQGPDYIARHLRGKVFGVLGWLVIVLAVLVLVDVFFLKNFGTLFSLINTAFKDYPNTGNPTWMLWGGWLLGLLFGGGKAALSSLRNFKKCQHISLAHLVKGHK